MLGSIPFGYILVRAFRGEDIRRTGSGNIGATNVSRSSPALGAITLVLDVLKGFAAVALTRASYPTRGTLVGLSALIAIAGHMFPIWLKFRGGKGVATGLGAFILLAPWAIVVTMVVFATVAAISRRISLASIVAVAVFPLAGWILNPGETRPMLAFTAGASILITAKHHGNIARLIAGTEPQIQWRRP